MKRTLSITVTVVSALLAVGVCCFWVRSYLFTDQFSWSACRDGAAFSRRTNCTILSAAGRTNLSVWWEYSSNRCQLRKFFFHKSSRGGRLLSHNLTRLGFYHIRASYPRTSPSLPPHTIITQGAPHWFFLVPTLPYPLSRVPGWLRQRRRVKRGLCIGCGYDLRGSSDRCPECGRETPRRNSALTAGTRKDGPGVDNRS